MPEATPATPRLVESMIAQARRCFSPNRECRKPKCKRCARGRAYAAGVRQ